MVLNDLLLTIKLAMQIRCAKVYETKRYAQRKGERQNRMLNKHPHQHSLTTATVLFP